MGKKITCSVCDMSFVPTTDKHYIARDEEEAGLGAAFGRTKESVIYDAFDCPYCGCQVLMKERKRAYSDLSDEGNKVEEAEL